MPGDRFRFTKGHCIFAFPGQNDDFLNGGILFQLTILEVNHNII